MSQPESYSALYGDVTENELCLGPNHNTMLIIGGKTIGFTNEATAFRSFVASAPKAPVIPIRQPVLPATFQEISEAV